MDINWFRDKKITVMGLGLHGGGLGIAKWLLSRGARVTVTDLKSAAELAPSVAALEHEHERLVAAGVTAHRPIFKLGHHEDADFAGADLVIKNPAVRRDNNFLVIAASSGVPVETDIGLFFQLCPFPVIGVTGTKGKTTTTTLLADICRRYDRRTVIGGNIRVSALDALDHLLALAEKKRPAPPVLLELSSWQLEGLEKHRLSPHIGVITNVKEDHLNTYRDMDDYARAKELIVAFQNQHDFAVLNFDDDRVRGMGERLIEKSGAEPAPDVIWFSEKPVKEGDGCWISAGKVVWSRGGRKTAVFPVSAIRLPGRHNVLNVLAATAAACVAGIPAKTIAAAVRSFRGVPNRLELVATKNGVRYVNDTTATAPDASIAALRTFGDGVKKKVILLCGGADKSLHFEDWAVEAKRRAKALVLFDGTATPKMLAALDAVGAKTPRKVVGSMKEAMTVAKTYAKRGDIVLLSPACASFGIFINEFDRGDQFVREVKKIK